MKYPSQFLSQLADLLETYEPHEKIEALADRVNDLEDPIEEKPVSYTHLTLPTNIEV